MDILWHSEFAEQWRERVRAGRVPHAVLLAGAAGVGKRAAASWMAKAHLGLGANETVPQFPLSPIEHADLRWISPPEDKQTIGIDQIRTLVADFSLTSYHGKGKVAVIEPAETMTHNAANSLLKTLEEPPGNALLILIADRKGHLPATIFSRCQRIDIVAPSEIDAAAWLDRLQPGRQWSEALRLVGNAPLAALESVEQLEIHASMSKDFAAVAAGKASAIDVAAGWNGMEIGFVLGWMVRRVQAAIFRASGASKSGSNAVFDDSVLKRMDTRNLFCYLDIINRLRSQAGGSFNAQLALEGLLIDLADGLEGCGQESLAGELPAMTVKR